MGNRLFTHSNRRSRGSAALALTLFAACLFAGAPRGDAAPRATFVVTTTADSGPGSLRQAILNANATAGVDTVSFNIPGASPFTIALQTPLPTVTEQIVIDGTSQVGSVAGSPTIVVDGSATAAGSVGLTLAAPSSFVRGIAISGFPGTGIVVEASGCTIQGSYVGLPNGNAESGIIVENVSNVTIGGTVLGARNVISNNGAYGVFLLGAGASNNVVQGNYIGVDANGAAAAGNGFDGVYVNQGSSNAIVGNVISDNGGAGVYVDQQTATANSIRGNFIGTDVSGTGELGNTFEGIVIDNAPGNTIGGSVAGSANVIANNGAPGITITSPEATGNVVVGNRIGTGPGGTEPRGNAFEGVYIVDASDNQIGGTAAGEGNTIAFNGAAGVYVDLGAGNDILGNSIFSNTGLGIDLDPVGVTPNDNGDADAGANGLQNRPVIASVMGATVQGTLNSTASATFRIEFFANAECDESGTGEGQIFVGATSVTTDANGVATIAGTLSAALAAGQVLTATATGAAGTSEFSSCVAPTSGPTGADLSITIADSPDPVESGERITYTVRVTNAGPQAAESVTLLTATPLGTLFVSAVASQGTCQAPAAGATGVVNCSLGTIAANASVTVTIVVDVVATAGASIEIEGSVSSTTTDPTANNNTARATTTVEASVAPPVITEVKALTVPGKPFRIRISGTNLQAGAQVFIGADATPWPNVKYKNATRIVLKKGKTLKSRFPKGVPVTIRVVNPDGGEATATFTR